ncbi:MAG TPA: D-hexose-6-phosphate mutarotase [Chromatiaceae bacterium]|jgi:D-hexose-6-phosphate mutarotase|nr:D-hexose-6-phosphate mutarotase [Chromatiaceae bacterium]HIA07645.1 D-hexose-6-phosphate mutarotase [Chromatiaceae bacterium]HIN81520.1 D-hexose-6-phosphate mutarotase [Chromatiales bacterium]HIO53571.1 D-hexose-6-phosphate mutarotase [Chromatiales bacterium]
MRPPAPVIAIRVILLRLCALLMVRPYKISALSAKSITLSGMTSLSQLNTRFGISGRLEFVDGPGELIHARITNDHATALIALQGAHLTEYRPAEVRHGIIWMSQKAQFVNGRAIRGGVPVCWPWFGNHPTNGDLPAHGFLRTRNWDVHLTLDDGQHTALVLTTQDDESTRQLWPHAFQAELRIDVGTTLEIALTVTNTGTEAFTCGAALHSYFAVSDATQISIDGLDGCRYIDTARDNEEKTQTGAVTIDAEVDNVYIDTSADCVINDPHWDRVIRITKSGSHSTVVWNPWRTKSHSLSDFGDFEYPKMICIESANALDDQITVATGASHTLTTTISTTELDPG